MPTDMMSISDMAANRRHEIDSPPQDRLAAARTVAAPRVPPPRQPFLLQSPAGRPEKEEEEGGGGEGRGPRETGKNAIKYPRIGPRIQVT